MSNGMSKTELRRLFDLFDNGNGILSLAEIHAAVKAHYPHLYRHKKVIMKFYKIADANGSGFIEFKEFATLMSLLDNYDKIKEQFRELDLNGDHRISFDEFKKGYQLLNINCSNQNLREEFDIIDTNRSGYIVFTELCEYMAKKMTSSL